MRRALSVLRLAFVLVLFLAVPLRFFVSVTVAEIGEDEATLALSSAEGSVVSAYEAILEAESAGANVSDLLVRLNEAGDFLTRGRMAYSVEDFDSAFDFAVRCQEKLDGFVIETDALRGAAMQERYLDFLVNVVGSVMGAVAVVCVGFVSWFFLNRKYDASGSVAK